ncbi:MAG: peptidase domain-containing ABC transporter [Candidatus Micrarchaeaceae archaeon]
MTELNITLRHRLPLILQTEAAECGLACLAMVAGFHGYEIDLLSLRRRYPVSLKGTTLAQLMAFSEHLHFSTRAVRLELTDLRRLRRPAVLHWDLGHFVVLKGIRGRKVQIHDPARGAMVLGMEEVSKHFTGVALELIPTPRFEPRVERQRLPLRALWGHQGGLKGVLVELFVFSVALEMFAILAPYFMQFVVDRVLLADDWTLLTVLGIGFGILAVIATSVKAFRSWVILYLSTHLSYQMLSRLFGHLLRLPLDFFAKRHVGDIVSRFGSLQTIQQALTTQLVESIVDGVMVVGTLAIMVIYSASLTGIAVAMVIAYVLIRWILYRPLYEATQEQIVRQASQQSNFLETVRGMQGIRLFGAESLRHAEWQNLLAAQLNAQAGVGKLNIVFTLGSGMALGIGSIAIIWLGAESIMRGSFTVGMLFAFVAFTANFTTKAVSLIENGVTIRMLVLHSERVADIALSEPEEVLAPTILAPQRFSGAIEVRDVAYRYGEGEAEIFSGVTFEIGSGESVAITGPSGVGKSTLIKLMLGLLRPSGGAILVDGIAIERRGLTEYRKYVAAVLQDDRLYAGSIADNISFFDPRPDEERIESCAKLAAIHDDILAMPMGYRGLIGDMGSVFSGGQQQRVLLARALYRKPKVLFLDEATSHLDLGRETEINRAIMDLKITRIIVAHRPETLRYADRILTLSPHGVTTCKRSKDGRVVPITTGNESEIPSF